MHATAPQATPNPVHEDFLQQLKQRTAPAHEALESLPLSTVLMSPGLDMPQYAAYLQAMYHIHHDVENNIYDQLETLVPGITTRKKAGLILQDLEAIGSPLTEAPQRPVTGSAASFSMPFVMGIFYVIEGSSLGGRVILKHIQPLLGVTEDKGAAYFAGYKANTGMMWKQCLEILNQYQAAHQNGEEVIAGADFAFRRISDFFKAKP